MIIRSRDTKCYRGRGRSDPPLHPQKRTISPPPPPPHHSQHRTNSSSAAAASDGTSIAAPSSSGPSVAAPPSTAKSATAPPSTARSAAAPPSTARSAAAPPSTARSPTAPYATDDPTLETSSGDGSFAEIDRREFISVEDTSKPRRFVPPSVTRYIISAVMTRMPVPAERWKDYPFILKGLLFKDFMDTYRFASECDHAMAKVVWERTCMDRYPDYLKKARDMALKQVNSTNLADTKGHGPKGIIMAVWDGLVDIWLTPKWKNKSESSKRNRALMSDCMLHTGGSINLGEHKKRMEANLKHPVKFRDVYSHVHKKKDGEYVSQHSKCFVDSYDAKMQEKYGEDTSSHPVVDKEVWAEMSGPNKKGRFLGGHSLDIGFHGSIHSSSANVMGSSHKVQEDIKEAVNATISTFVETQLTSVLQTQLMSILKPILSNIHGSQARNVGEGEGAVEEEHADDEDWLY